MPKGTLDTLPEIFPQIGAWLPRGITVVSANPYGGAMRLELEGKDLEEGCGYQLVVTEDPMRRVIELVKNPNQNG